MTPRDVVTGYFAALGRRDTAAAAEFLSPDVVEEITSVGVLRGRDEVRAFFDGLFKAAPDLEVRAERTIRERDTVVVQWRMQGTFNGSGPLPNGVQPTGAELRMRGCDVLEVKDDLIVHNAAFQDGLELARSLGMMPPQDSPAEKAMIGAFNGATKVRAALRDRFGPSGG
jgi:ketosteroid isomerase-like protein